MFFDRKITNSIERIQLLDGEDILLTVAPQFGARLTSLKLKNQGRPHDVLWSVSDEDLTSNAWYKNTILFPFPNRLEDGKYEFEGTHYQFPINEPDKHNQLHGMLHSAPFEEKASKVKGDVASITLAHEYNGALPYYPFPFRFEVTYVYKSGMLEVVFRVTNTGHHSLPFGMGWHPYFQIDGQKILDCSFAAQKLSRLKLSDRSLPTGEKQSLEAPVFHFDRDQLDDAFTVDYRPVAYTLSKQDLNIHFQVSESLNFLQVFTPEGGDAVAIEPMTCNINMLNNHDGMRLLAPAEAFECTIDVSLN